MSNFDNPHAEANRRGEFLTFDAFISHASEDKDTVVRDLAAELTRGGAKIWFDEWTLEIGDSLRRTIDRGLRNSRYGVVVLSPNFFAKEWPQAELDALFARETLGGKVILPVWHNLSKADVVRFAPLLGERMAARTSEGIVAVASKILACVRSAPRSIVPEPVAPRLPRAPHEEPALLTDLLQTIDTIAPLCYGLDRPLSGLDARTFLDGLQRFFHGWNFVNRGIDKRVRYSIDNLLRVILARGDVHYALGKLNTAAAYLSAYLKGVEPSDSDDWTPVTNVRIGMHDISAELSISLDLKKTMPTADLNALRVMLPLAIYGQRAWSERDFPLIDANIHRSVRDMLEELVPQHLSYAMPDRLDRISNIDLQVACEGPWRNLRDFEDDRDPGFWRGLIRRLLRPRAKAVTAADLIT